MDIYQRKWHDAHARNIRKRESTHEERLRRRKEDLITHRSKAAMRKNLKVPEIMSIFENCDQTIKFINDIKETVFNDNLYAILDFSKCKEITAETCVVLAAEIDRCNKLFPESVTGTYPKDVDVYFLLNELGFFHLLGIRSTKPEFDDLPEVDVVRLQSGADNPINLMRGIKELFYKDGDEDENIQSKSPFSKKVFRALTEAMGNAVEHAYPEDFKRNKKDTCIPKWWRAGFKVNEDNMVIMILYDQGAGIPNTLKTNWKEKLDALASVLTRDPYDDEKIALAMEKGRTSTKVKGRGQGSFDMQKLIRESSDGILSIFSYKGAYSYFNSGKYETFNLDHYLEGTLIVWRICLNSLAEEI
jgi:hypothetical protein